MVRGTLCKSKAATIDADHGWSDKEHNLVVAEDILHVDLQQQKIFLSGAKKCLKNMFNLGGDKQVDHVYVVDYIARLSKWHTVELASNCYPQRDFHLFCCSLVHILKVSHSKCH